MLRNSLALLRNSLGVVVPALLAAGCPSDATPVTGDDSSSSGAAESTTSSTTTDEPDTSSTIDPSMTSVDPDSSSSSTESSSGTGFVGCGDGDLDGDEECDGDNLDGRDCMSEDFVDGVLACNADCTLDTSGCNFECGDGDVQGDEQCEGNDLDGADCVSVGFDGGDLGCDASCMFDTTACENYTCGDGLAAGPEICDGLDLTGEDCGSLGFDSGTLGCADDCGSFDLSQCFVCGDGIINGDETCDGNDLAGEDCLSQGLDGGEISCASDCTLDLSACVGCGNGDQDPGEECDGNDYGGVNCSGMGFDGGQLTCAPGCVISTDSCLGLHTFCTQPAAAIGPGPGGLTVSTIPVAGLAGAVIDVDISIVATHTAVGDLDIDLRHVDSNISVALADDQCGTSDNIDAIFDQDAAAPPTCVGPTAISGSVLPQGNLDSYVATVGPGNGTWELGIVDQLANNGGTLDQWCVSITTGSSCATPFAADAYDESMIFADAPGLNGTRMTLAFDGLGFWSSAGGGAEGDVLAAHDADGGFLQYYQPNLDLRSVFTKGDGLEPVFSRAYADNQIRVQGPPGVFANDILLVGGALDAQSAVVWDEDASEFVAHNAGTVTRWDAAGALVGSVALAGYGDLPGENEYPQNRGLATACGYYLTYVGGTLSAWDLDGNRLASTTLNNGGVSFDSYFSYSYAQGLFFVNDGAGGSWRGYEVL